MLQVQVLIDLLNKSTGHPAANTKLQVASELCVSRVVFVYCIIGRGGACPDPYLICSLCRGFVDYVTSSVVMVCTLENEAPTA